MNRRCRYRECRRPIPPHAESDVWEAKGFCCRSHAIEHGREQAEKWKKNANKRKRENGPGPNKERAGWRSERYLEWVRSQPCACCGAKETEAHHIIASGNLSGMGMTAPDQYAMPLCRDCHRRVHEDPALQHWQWEWVARTLARAVENKVV